MHRPSQPESRPRTTVALAGTTKATQADLDHTSALALAYAQEWNRRHGRLKVPSSAVVRRALLLYAQHLDGISDANEARREARAVHSAARPVETVAQVRQAAQQRLQAASESSAPLPPFRHVLEGAEACAQKAQAAADLIAQAEALAALAAQDPGFKAHATRNRNKAAAQGIELISLPTP